MSRLTNIYLLAICVACSSCAPRVATSFWKIGTEADSVRPGYTVIHAEGKTRHCYPISQWEDSADVDTYHHLHHHGVAVESELMAYRLYFDKKQTIDVYCKRKPQLELAQSYWYPNDSLLAEGYGDDILRVSGTVGVGSVKYWNGTKQVHINAGKRAQYIGDQTRRQASIGMLVKDWQVEGLSEEMEVQYTMYAGHRDMRCDVYTTHLIEGLCTGVQTIPAKGGKDTVTIVLPNGILLASWGTDWPVNDTVKYGKETVGLGVFIPKAYAGTPVHDKQNNLCLLKLSEFSSQNSDRYTAHFYLTVCGATKENHPVATNATEWYAYLLKWAKSLRYFRKPLPNPTEARLEGEEEHHTLPCC